MMRWSLNGEGGVQVQFNPAVVEFVRKLRQEIEAAGPYKPAQPPLQVAVSEEIADRDPLAKFEAGQLAAEYQDDLAGYWQAQDELASEIFDNALAENPTATIELDQVTLTLLHQWLARTALIVNKDKLTDRIGVGEPLLGDDDLQKLLEPDTAKPAPAPKTPKIEVKPEAYDDQRHWLPRKLATMLIHLQYKAMTT